MIRLGTWVGYRANRYRCRPLDDGEPECRWYRLGQQCDKAPSIQATKIEWTFEGEHTKCCPLRLVPAWYWQLPPLFTAYRNGMLVAPGSYHDQPAPYVRAMEEMARVVNRLDAERMQSPAKGEDSDGDR